MGLAHYLTFLRIIVSPLFPLIYAEHEWLGISTHWMPYILLFLLAIGESSDLMDGIIARRRNQVSDLGKVLDPMADSVMRISLFLTFTMAPVGLPLALVLVFFYRDFFITTLRTLCALHGVALAARTSGKVKAVTQASVLFLILILLILQSDGLISQESLHQIGVGATLFAAIYTVLSALDYIYANREHLKKSLKYQ